MLFQVTATPYNLLTENTRIPETLVVRQRQEGNNIGRKTEFNLTAFTNVEVNINYTQFPEAMASWPVTMLQPITVNETSLKECDWIGQGNRP